MTDMISVIFPVSLIPDGDIDIPFDVTKEEYDLLLEAEDSSEELCDVDTLQDLYERVCEATYDELANYIFDNQYVIDTYLDGEYDFEKAREYVLSTYRIYIDYPSIDES